MTEVSTTDNAVGRLPFFRNPLRMFFSAEPWLALVFMFASFALGVAWFTVLVTLISTGFGMAITLVGIPILIGTLFLWMYGAKFERLRVRLLLGVPIPDPYAPVPQEGNLWDKLKARLVDRFIWQDLLYLFLLFPIGIAQFVVGVTVIATVGASLTAPIWLAFGGDVEINETFDAWIMAPLIFIGGLLLLVAAPYIFAGIGRGHAWLAQILLGKNREAELEARVDELTVSRSRALDSAVVDLRRIERDLHDGAQQRLVKLSMDLGLAKEMLETDPETARELIDEAHEESKRAMQEIRDLARGIHPAILTDRGLQPAITALAARSAIPVEVNVAVEGRLSSPLESAAYFIVAEALTNIARHSQATRATISIRRFGDLLFIDVEDDGVGDAQIGRGSGLTGLEDRVSALEGRVIVESPPGKGTLVHVELPCGS